jgi:hypothetical protein
MVVIRRPTGGTRAERLRVNFDDVVDGTVPPLVLAPGDTVYVP